MVVSLDNAQELLSSYQLDAAETMFLKLYQRCAEKPENHSATSIQALSALAEICICRSRLCRDNPLEWQWLYMHAIALNELLVDVCNIQLETVRDNQDESWYLEQRNSAKLKIRPLEETLNRTLYDWLKQESLRANCYSSRSLSTTPSSSLFPSSQPMFPTKMLPSSSLQNLASYQQEQTTEDIIKGLEVVTKFQAYCHDRLRTGNFNELRDKILMETNGDPQEDTIRESIEWNMDEIQDVGDVNALSDVSSPVKEFSLAYELGASDVDSTGWDFFLEDRRNCVFHTIIQLSPETQNELAFDDERADSYNDIIMDTQVDNDAISHSKSTVEDKPDKEMFSPLSERNINIVLAKSLCHLAESISKEGQNKTAEFLYQQVLHTLDEVYDNSMQTMQFHAETMKRLGMIKCQLGKFAAGIKLLEKALKLLKEIYTEEENIELAFALFELANGYLAEKINEEAIFDDIIATVAEFFEKESNDEDEDTAPSGMPLSSSQLNLALPESCDPPKDDDNQHEESMEKLQQAMFCYKDVIMVLDQITNKSPKHNNLYAKTLMKQGDCNFMLKEYSEALDLFEKAQKMYMKSSGSTPMIEIAHVYSMLGVANFMLHMYPKAVSVYMLGYTMIKHAYGVERHQFIIAMVLSLLGITYYKMKNYPKCISVCYQAYDTYAELYHTTIPKLPTQRFWLVCQTLYVMGVSYNILGMHDKGITYLGTGRAMMMSAKYVNRRQFLRILQVLGDCYFAQYDYKTALTFYNEALERGIADEDKKEFEIVKETDKGLENQILSRSADAHLSMNQYQHAFGYLEEVHDIQDNLQGDIKEDLISTLHQLGQMHSKTGDVDKAIESYMDSIEIYKEIHGQLGPDMCATLGNLAAMCYVKACICENIDEELQMILNAEKHFQDALGLEMNHTVCVKYANFLYSQGNYEDAVMYLDDALPGPREEMVFSGVEMVTLPEVLQEELNDHEEVVIPAACLASYLLYLSHIAQCQYRSAERCLLDLLSDAIFTDEPIRHSVTGYALMEFQLFEEAAISFAKVVLLEETNNLALDNYCICLIMWVQWTLQKAIFNMLTYYNVI